MFLLEKKKNKAILTVYGYVGGYYLDYRAVTSAVAEITNEGYTRLDVHLHTYGGYVFDGNLILNALESFKGEIDMYIDGVAASMGSILIMAGTRIHIAENGFVMIHAPRGGAEGTASDLIKYAKLLRSMEKNFIAKLIARTGKPEDEVAKWMDGDNWFDADEAIAAGLVDDKFSPKTDTSVIEKSEAVALGAKGTFERFAALTISKPNLKTDMDKKTLIARYGLTTVNEQSSDEEVMAAIDKKLADERTKATNAEAAQKASEKAAIKAAVDAAVKAGKISNEKTDEYVARGEKIGLGELNAILADMHVYNPISKSVQGKGTKGEPTDRTEWDWDKYQKEDPEALTKLRKDDNKAFAALYKAKYGCDPEE